jgi:hypothetical protein
LIDTNNSDLNFNMALTSSYLSEDQLAIIKANSEWDEDSKEYRIPPFYFKDKKLVFPKVEIL